MIIFLQVQWVDVLIIILVEILIQLMDKCLEDILIIIIIIMVMDLDMVIVINHHYSSPIEISSSIQFNSNKFHSNQLFSLIHSFNKQILSL